MGKKGKRSKLGETHSTFTVNWGELSDKDWWKRLGLGSDSPAKPVEEDLINHPPHYTRGKIEVIDFIEDQALGYHESNALKYICRARWKGKELSDLKKAIWYLNRKIQRMA